MPLPMPAYQYMAGDGDRIGTRLAISCILRVRTLQALLFMMAVSGTETSLVGAWDLIITSVEFTVVRRPNPSHRRKSPARETQSELSVSSLIPGLQDHAPMNNPDAPVKHS
jgi:hypothetical protein